MITKFKIFNESKETGIFNINNNGVNITLKLKYDYTDKGLIIKLIKNTEEYAELSVVIPETKKLNKNEFFINPDIDQYIIDKLIDGNFINSTDIEAKAGDKKVKAYTLNFS